HCRALSSGRIARANPIRPRPSTRIALRTRASFEVRNPAKIEKALWHKNHPRRPLPRWLKNAPDPAVLLYNDPFFLLRLRQENACEKKTGHESILWCEESLKVGFSFQRIHSI